MVLDDSIPTPIGDFAGNELWRYVLTNTGSVPLTSVSIEAQATPDSEWQAVVDQGVDVQNLHGLLGYTITDDSLDLMTLGPGEVCSIHMDCSKVTRVRFAATGPAGAEATVEQVKPAGFPPDLSASFTGPGGAGLIGTIPGHGLFSTDVQASLYELADMVMPDQIATASTLGLVKGGLNIAIDAFGQMSYTLPAGGAALGGVKNGGNVVIDGSGNMDAPSYTLPVATASVLGGVKQGANVTIAGDGTISGAAAYTLPVASASVLGGVKEGANISIDVNGVISSTAGGTGTVTSVNGQSPVAGAVTIVTSHIAENTNLYYTDARVRAAVLTGLSLSTGTAITAADTVLSAAGKLQKQITDTIAIVPAASSSTPLVAAGAGAVGTATTYARADHVHPSGGGGGGSMTLLATLTPTAAANVDFLSTFSSTYDNYLILLSGISPSANDSLMMRFAASGAADSSVVYARAIGIESNTGVAATSDSMYINVNTLLASGNKGLSAVLHVLNANGTTSVKYMLGKAGYTSSGTGNHVLNGTHGGYVGTSAATGFRLFWLSGATFVATGTVRVYGYNNT